MDPRHLMTFLALAGTIWAQDGKEDSRRWAEGLASFHRFSAGRDPLDRARAAWELGNATSAKYDRQCWQLLSALLRQELAREGLQGRTEEKVSGEVLDACVGALRQIRHPDVVAEMTKAARNKADNPRVRLHLVWALAAHGDLKGLAELLDGTPPIVQVAAADALAERADASSVPLFLRLLREDRAWEVKLAALQGLERAGDAACVDPLIDDLNKCRPDEGRLKDQYLKVLKKFVGADVASDDPNAWRAAWAAKRQGKDPAKLGVDTVSEPTEFYGLKTFSTRIVFLLDRTGSMALPGSDLSRPLPARAFTLTPEGSRQPPLELAAREEALRILRKYEDRKVQSRMDAAKKELIRTVILLRPQVHFNVVWYEGQPKPWKTELVPASWANKLDCLKDTDRLHPSGMTNIWEAVETAYKMIELARRPGVVQLDKHVNYATALGGADTFFLMTDGQPTEGRLLKSDEILSEIRKVNRLRRVTFHTICVGDLLPGADPLDNPDPAFLQKIAGESGGSFTHVRR